MFLIITKEIEHLQAIGISLSEQSQGNCSFQTGIASIALLVGAVGIITILYTSVNERIKEMGCQRK